MTKNKVHFVIFVDEKRNGGASWLGIGYIKAYLSEKYDVVVSYYNFNEIDIAVKDFLNNTSPILGLPILQHNMNVALEYAEKIKKNAKVKIVSGNIIPTLYADVFLSLYPQIDVAVIGEGEVTMLELCDTILSGRSLSYCKGIAFRNEIGEVIRNAPRPLIPNLDDLPFPDRSIYSNQPTAYGVLGSRGCKGRCTFCDSRTILGDHVRTRSIPNIIDEVEFLINNYKCNYIGFYDSTFCANIENSVNRIQELYETLKTRNININFQLNIRAEQVNNAFCDKLIDLIGVGLNDILIGLEAGNDTDLKLYSKPAQKKDNINAINIMRQKGLLDTGNKIFLEYGFINFNPYSTRETLIENLEFLYESGLPVDFSVLSSHLALYGGAAICKKVKNDNLLFENQTPIIKDPLGYNYLHEEIKRIYDLVEFCHTYYVDGVKKNIELHFNVYCKYFKHSSEMEDAFLQYCKYKKDLTCFSLGLVSNIINCMDRESNELKYELDKFYFMHRKEIDCILAFQKRLTMELFRNGKLVIY